MLGYETLDIAEIGASQSSAFLLPYRIQPELRHMIVTFNVHMLRLVAISCIKEESVWTMPQDGRHPLCR